MAIIKFFSLIALACLAVIGYAVCISILANWVDKKYGNKIREWAKKRLPERFFADSSKDRGYARYNHSPECDCNICPIKEIQQWFEKSGRVCLAIKNFIHKASLGRHSHYKNNEGYPKDGTRNSERYSHNPMHHGESVSDFSQGGQPNANRTETSVAIPLSAAHKEGMRAARLKPAQKNIKASSDWFY
jgi:hypothetical protein